ncbi:MAG: CocE/NonD family hydrolase [Chloroflexi bacterium]|nr:CocE/NonD family hydrolase [Chloroflexota bacterium]
MAVYRRMIVEHDVPVPMRDGLSLLADLYVPDGPGPWPALLQRTPYNKAAANTIMVMLDTRRALRAGYAVVIQDVRGRYESPGEFEPFANEVADGYDTVEWVAAQPWCNGQVAMFGISYVGATQWLAAIGRPPHLAAIAPTVTSSDYYEGWTYQGGAFELSFCGSWGAMLALNQLQRAANWNNDDPAVQRQLDAQDGLGGALWSLPLGDIAGLAALPAFQDWLAHPTFDDYWRRWRIADHYSRLDLPVFNTGGWYDIFLGGTLQNYTGMRAGAATPAARAAQRLVIGPWEHVLPFPNKVGEWNFGHRASAGMLDRDGLLLRWLDWTLKGEANGAADDPPVRLFVMGENRWRAEEEWPLRRAVATPYFLRGGGRANSRHGDGWLSPTPPAEEPADHYVYNPRDPVPTRGGGLCCSIVWTAGGVYDQRSIEDRPDVLVYSTRPLERAIEVTGPITVTLYAATSAPDTDWTAKLVDVYPDGYVQNLTDGILRARYRHGTERTVPLTPGAIERYEIDLWATSNVFMPGHRLRLEISSSNFPRFDRNPNTGLPATSDADLQPAFQTIFHDSERPSHVTLPIVAR